VCLLENPDTTIKMLDNVLYKISVKIYIEQFDNYHLPKEDCFISLNYKLEVRGFTSKIKRYGLLIRYV